MVISLNKENFDREVMSSELPVLVDFWASWCGPCRMVSPIIDELAEEYDGRVKVCKVNVDEEGGIASEYAVVSIPTVLIIKNGKVVNKSVGARGKDEFCDMLDEIL